MKTMNRKNPKYNEFMVKLSHEIKVCDHSFKHAEKILEEFGVDIQSSINFFKENGGYCDCEIMFNVDR